MKVKYISEKWLKDEIKKRVGKHVDLSQYKLFVFGSRARGDNFERSDIDLGIQGKKPLSSKKKFAIIDELEKIPTLYKFDFVDFTAADPSFRKEAAKEVEILA